MNFSPYRVLLLTAMAVTLLIWTRLARRRDRLVLVYGGALLGAFLGAKLVYLLAEGWLHFGAPDMWLQWATGKSILGGLLGGYAGVEIAKAKLRYTAATGDWFAVVTPVAIALGRIGCFLHGCCLGKACETADWYTLRDANGIDRWPAVPLEFGFNVAALGVILVLRRRQLLAGQHFHLYLIGYGIFRFLNEIERDTPRVFGWLSGYQLAALAVLALGLTRFQTRRHMQLGSSQKYLKYPGL